MQTAIMTDKPDAVWPSLPYEAWKDTKDTLHMWMQIVGKIKLALVPFVNHWWEVAFYLTANGMTTGRIPYNNQVFQVDFDFIGHNLVIRTSNNQIRTMPLEPRSVAEFYKAFMDALQSLGIRVTIRPVPTEVPNTIPFPEDTQHAAYDPDYVTRWWRIQLQICNVFDRFRTPFRGKSSPIHLFWGSLDLNGARFNGKPANPPKMEGAMGRIMRFAENEENFAFGFWPGDQRFPHPALYSYLYPAPEGMATINFGPDVSFNELLSECILPYEAVRKADHPEQKMMSFLEQTYAESAKLAGWDTKSLEGPLPSNLKI